MEEDLQDQTNKRHNSQRLKLKKRRKQEKEIKKEKSKKKKEYDREAHKAVFFGKKETKKEAKEKHKDKYRVNQKKLFKWLQKFVKVFTDEISEFLDIFKVFEEGEDVDINDMENMKIKTYLHKIFKTLKLSENKFVFQKKKKCKVENLHEYMCKKYQEFKEQNEKNSSNSSSSDQSDDDNDLDIEDDSEQEQENEIKKKQSKSNPQASTEQNSSIGPSIGPSRVEKTMMGPSRPTNEKGDEIDDTEIEKFKAQVDNLIEVKKSNPNRDDWMQGDFDSFMNDTFKGVEQKKLKQFLDKRQKPVDEQNQKTSNKNLNYAEGSARMEDNEENNQDKVQQFMEQYNSNFRQKSLFEIHQEKQKEEKERKLRERGKEERKPFNREKDMKVGNVDSKRLFAALKQKDVLSTKFQSSGSGRSFM